jgi:glycosyltransferase involved in cell wall biosynthesis
MVEPLRVGIDLTSRLPVPTGVDTFLEQLVLALGDEDPATRYTIWVNVEDRGFFDGRLPENFAVAPRCLRPRPVRLLFQQLAMPALAAASRLDVVHSPSFIMPFVRGRQRHLLTVYDMTSFSHPECHEPLRRSRAYRWAILTSLRRAHLISVPSRATRSAVLRFAPDIDERRLRVVRPGIDGAFWPRTTQEIDAVRSRHGIGRPYVLYLGTLDPRKNLHRLVQAFSRMVARTDRPEYLVLAGQNGWDGARLEAAIETSGVADRIRRLGYVAGDDLPALLSGAALFVYPSLEEGFGFPPVEAMACGTPTIATDTSSLTENLAGAAELVPASDVEALAAAIERVLVDGALSSELSRRGKERAARFRWRLTAAATVDCYRELAAKIDTLSQQGSYNGPRMPGS